MTSLENRVANTTPTKNATTLHTNDLLLKQKEIEKLKINLRSALAIKAELQAQDALFSTTLTLQFQNELVEKLLKREERFDRVVLDKKIESREAYFESLPKHLEQAKKLKQK